MDFVCTSNISKNSSFQFFRSFHPLVRIVRSFFLLSVSFFSHAHPENQFINLSRCKKNGRSWTEKLSQRHFSFSSSLALCARWKINYVLNLWSCRATKIVLRFGLLLRADIDRRWVENGEIAPSNVFLRFFNFNWIKFTVVKKRCAWQFICLCLDDVGDKELCHLRWFMQRHQAALDWNVF